MIKGTVPKGWHLKPPPRYGAESSLMSHTQNRLIQVIRQCALQKPPSQMLLGQQPAQTAQRKRAWNANYVQAQSVGRVVSLDLPSLFLGKHTNIHSPDIPNIL